MRLLCPPDDITQGVTWKRSWGSFSPYGWVPFFSSFITQ